MGEDPPRLAIRPLRPDEADRVVAYFLGASDEDARRMGLVERDRLPAPAEWAAKLRQALAAPPESVTSAYVAWLVDGEAVGFASLKNIRPGDRGEMHLHMWSPAHRGKGHGAALFCLSALDFAQRFRLRRIVCEPKADNPMPNRMLAKAGFPLLRTFEGSSSELSAVTTLNQYGIQPAVAAAYLRRHGVPIPGTDLGALPPRQARPGQADAG